MDECIHVQFFTQLFNLIIWLLKGDGGGKVFLLPPADVHDSVHTHSLPWLTAATTVAQSLCVQAP